MARTRSAFLTFFLIIYFWEDFEPDVSLPASLMPFTEEGGTESLRRAKYFVNYLSDMKKYLAPYANVDNSEKIHPTLVKQKVLPAARCSFTAVKKVGYPAPKHKKLSDEDSQKIHRSAWYSNNAGNYESILSVEIKGKSFQENGRLLQASLYVSLDGSDVVVRCQIAENISHFSALNNTLFSLYNDRRKKYLISDGVLHNANVNGFACVVTSLFDLNLPHKISQVKIKKVKSSIPNWKMYMTAHRHDVSFHSSLVFYGRKSLIVDDVSFHSSLVFYGRKSLIVDDEGLEIGQTDPSLKVNVSENLNETLELETSPFMNLSKFTFQEDKTVRGKTLTEDVSDTVNIPPLVCDENVVEIEKFCKLPRANSILKRVINSLSNGSCNHWRAELASGMKERTRLVKSSLLIALLAMGDRDLRKRLMGLLTTMPAVNSVRGLIRQASKLLHYNPSGWIKNDLRLLTSSFFKQYRSRLENHNASVSPACVCKHLFMNNKAAKNKSPEENCSGNKKRPKGEETFEGNISKSGFLGWCSSLFNFDFFTPPTRNVFVAPATRFLPEMGRSQEDVFSYEGIRLASLCHLPSTCSVSRVRLAKAGFYFDASKTTRDARNLDEVVCYSCGVTYANWESGANPETIHRQLSPNCPHLKDQQEPVPERSHVKTLETDGEINSGACSPGFGSATSTKTNILSSDPNGVHSYFVLPRTSTTSEKNPFLGLRGGKLDSHTSPGTVNPAPKFDGTLETDCAASLPSDNTGYSPDFNDRPEMPLGSAVYPHFSSSQTRYSTFTAWTLSNISHFQPHLLVSLGFFYAGYADCIRCFHCGVGLKSWHPDDDPLVEHIRWRPHCGFLLATKGRRFVNNTLASLQKNQQEPTIENRTHGSSFTNGTSTNIAPARERSSIANLSPTNLGQLRDMGFKDEQISKAVQELGHSGSQITEVQALIDRLLELTVGGEEYENIPNVPRDSVPSRCDLSTDGCNSTSGSNVANRFRELNEENERLKERKLCKVCKSSTVGMIFLPCGHIVACTQCGAKIRHCTSCGEFVKATANIYLS